MFGSNAVAEVVNGFSTAGSAFEAGHVSVSATRRSNVMGVVFVVWIAGVIVCLARELRSLLHCARLRRCTAAWPEIEVLLASLAPNVPRLVSTDSDIPPHTWTFRHSAIFLPASARAWPPEQMRCVLLHELAHIRRGDFLTHLAARLVCSFYWFQPLAWIAVRRLSIEQERACDDAAIERGAPAADYAAMVIELVRVFRGAATSVSMASHLRHRIESIIDSTQRRRPMNIRTRTAFALITLAAALPLAAFSPEESGATTRVAAHADDPIHFRWIDADSNLEVTLAGAARFGSTVEDIEIEKGGRLTIRGTHKNVHVDFVFERGASPQVDSATHGWLDGIVSRIPVEQELLTSWREIESARALLPSDIQMADYQRLALLYAKRSAVASHGEKARSLVEDLENQRRLAASTQEELQLLDTIPYPE
jgi:beta-lactamase regulating signal transducer with metallopeptidase domain